VPKISSFLIYILNSVVPNLFFNPCMSQPANTIYSLILMEYFSSSVSQCVPLPLPYHFLLLPLTTCSSSTTLALADPPSTSFSRFVLSCLVVNLNLPFLLSPRSVRSLSRQRPVTPHVRPVFLFPSL
jgi:hypothetical protein